MSHGSSSDDEMGAIAWPGFVDILSSVTIVFVFFVMIVSVTLFFHMIIFKGKILKEAEQQVKEQVAEQTHTQALKETSASDSSPSAQSEAQSDSPAVKALEKKLKSVEEEKEVLEKVLSEYEQEFYQARAEFDESTDQTLKNNVEQKEIIVFFGRESITLTEDIKTKINAVIQGYITKHGADKITINLESSLNPGFAIENSARQIAVARMLNVRNALLDNKIPPSKIVPVMVKGYEIDANYNWVKVVFEIE